MKIKSLLYILFLVKISYIKKFGCIALRNNSEINLFLGETFNSCVGVTKIDEIRKQFFSHGC